MLIIPAVDIKGGRCVRLLRGRAEEETVYFDDPLDAARNWIEGGAELIHVVDLDGALSGRITNAAAIERIVKESGSVRIEVGGGIRTEEDIETLLGLGVDRVIIGTVAAESPERMSELCSRFPGRIAVGVDAENDKIAVQGWKSVTELGLFGFVKALGESGACVLIYTDITRDGTLSGPNVERTREVSEASIVPVVASGGVSSLDDIRSLKDIPLEGVIVGKALYEKRFALPEAIAVLDE